MLDCQQRRLWVRKREIHFTRRLLIAHLVLGALLIGLFAAHDLQAWAVGALLWYLLTLAPLRGMLKSADCCRHVLGALFLLFSACGVFFLTQVAPQLPAAGSGLLPHHLLPFWLGSLNLVYASTAGCLFFHHNVRKAVAIGFSLW